MFDIIYKIKIISHRNSLMTIKQYEINALQYGNLRWRDIRTNFYGLI